MIEHRKIGKGSLEVGAEKDLTAILAEGGVILASEKVIEHDFGMVTKSMIHDYERFY